MSSARGGERGRARASRSKTLARGGAHNNTRNSSGNASDSDGGTSSFRGRGRGTTFARGAPARGAPTGPRQKQPFGGPQAARPPSRSNNSAPQSNGFQPASTAGLPWPQRYDTLKSNRTLERKHAIAHGLIQDPDKPRRLEDAITIVGTCPDMCAEYERVERVVQKDIWELESDPITKEPVEHRMVKKFRRAAAGLEEQLPSDLRPPTTLSKTCDYLFNDILSEYPLAKSHKFLWDRTRAVRNDFTIQQCTKTPDIRIQIDCFERIARFHILSLHQMALSKEEVPTSYDRHQDREQLDKTLLTLITLYDENRERYRSSNEPEFRAYSILFQMMAIVPDIEDRIQSWPPEIIKNPRVQTALKIYAAAADVYQPLGPLTPQISHPTAQSNIGRFFNILRSSQVSYLMACVAEMSFNQVRRTMLKNIWNAYRIGGDRKVEDWTLQEVTRILNFDDEEETREFCEAYGFSVVEKEDGTEFLDLTSVPGKSFPAAGPELRKQFRSEAIVESKRYWRAYSAIVGGLTVKQARERAMIEEPLANGDQPSLFVNQDEESDTETMTTTTASFTQPANPFAAAAAAPKNPFAPAAPSAFGAPAAPSGFGAPSTSSPFGKPATPVPQPSPFGFGTPSNQGSISSTSTSYPANPFSPFSTASTTTTTTTAPSASSSPFQLGSSSAAPSPFAQPASNSPAAQPSPFQLGAQTTPFSAFGQPVPTLKSTTPTTSFEQPSDTPPGSPPKSSVFGGMTSSVSTSAPTPFFPPTTSAPHAGKENQQPVPASEGNLAFPSAKPAASGGQQPAPMPSIFGFPPVITKSSAPTVTAPAAPASSPFSGFTSVVSDANQTSALPGDKNPFGFTASQVSGTSPAQFSPKPSQDSAPATEQPTNSTSFFPSTTPSSSAPDTPASQPSIGAFNPSKFSAPTSITQTASPPSAPFTLENHTATPPTPPKTDSAPTQPPSFTPASSLTSAQPSFTPASSVAPAPPSFTPASSFAPAPPAAHPPTATPQPSASNALAIAKEKARKERLSSLAIDKITENLVLEPKAGLLTQFIEHLSQSIVLDAIREFQDEQDRKVADEFRARSLATRYGQKWRGLWRSAKASRRGRERRKARRDALSKSASQRGAARVEADVRDFKNTMGASMRRMAASNGARSDGNFRDSFSEDFGVHDILERDRRRRSTVSRQESYMMSGALSSTRRSSAQSDALGPNNDEFRVSKSRKAPIQPPTRYRAAFLSGQPLIPKESTYTGRISTTQSDYWRLVSLGINPDDVRGDRNSRKRYREFDADEEALMSSGDEQSTSPPERKKRIAMGTRDGYRLSQSGTPSGENRNAGTPTSAPSTYRDRADSNASEDPLLAKFRLLRKTLNEETDFMRSMNQQLEKRTSESIRSSSADPRDCSYNSFRSSHFPQVQAASVSRPAYWDRDSKFLPRSEYGGARWLAQKQMEKGKEKVVEQSPQLMKSNSASQLPTQSSTSVTTQSSKMSFSEQIPASQPMDSQENPANAFSVFAPGSNNLLDSAAPSNSFSSAVPDSNPFVQTQPSDQPTPNGVGTQGDEIMILSSDDDDDDDDDDDEAKGQEVQSQIPVKSKEYPTSDDDEIMEVNHDELSQSIAGEFQYGQHEEFGSQFEDQYRYAQGFETLDKEDSEIMRDEVDPALLDEDDEEESQVAGEDDEEGDASEDANEDDDEDSGSVDEDDEDEDELEDGLEDDLEDESSVDEEEIVEDEDESLEEESASEDASDERDATPNAKYKDKGNSFEDAIEL